MMAIEMTAPGGADVLMPTQVNRPVPRPGEILIKVAAAGVNRPDILQRRGLYPPPPGASDILGLEVAGTVEGENHYFPKGCRVMALLPGGGYAEYAVAKADHVIEIPDHLSFEAAAGLPETVYTVWANVMEAGALQKGETLFVHGATSGIGTMAASIGNAFGATVYGTAGSPEKCAAAERLGFAKCYNYREDDWADQMVKQGGADVVLDMVGGDYVAKNLSFLNHRGRHISIAFLQGATATLPIFPVMQKQLVLTGSTLRGRTDDEKARLTAEIEEHILPHIRSKNILPIIDRVFPMQEAAQAHGHMEQGDHVGKIILSV